MIPCDKLIEAHLTALKWNMQRRLFSLTASLQQGCMGRVPLMSCYIGGNARPTLPHSFGNRAGANGNRAGFQRWERQRKQAGL